MRHAEALRIAERLRDDLAEYCERIEIAGSVRRGKAEVKDIELVAIPKTQALRDMLNYETVISALDRYQWSLLGTLTKNGPRYKKILTYEGISLDLFVVLPPAQFGVIYTIRTGPAEFSQWCVTPRSKGGGLPSDCRVSDGRVLRYGSILPMPEEIDYLRLLGFAEGISPEKREANWRRK